MYFGIDNFVILSDFPLSFQPDEDQEEFDHFTDEEEFEVFFNIFLFTSSIT